MRARYAVLCAAVAVAAGVTAVPAAAAAESIDAHVTTARPMVDQQLTIEGDVTGAPMYPVQVAATREDSTGTTPTPVDSQPTDANGHFTLHDTPPARGHVTYHLSADTGAATTDVTTTVAGKQTELSIHVSPSPADADTGVHVVAHLGSPTTNRVVTIYARPYQRSRTQIDSGPVDANGDRAASRTVHRRTTFIAVFSGDSAYEPARTSVTLRVRAVIREHLKGGYANSGGRRLYHQAKNPRLLAHVLPEHKYACVRFRAQHRSHGRWVRSAVSPCADTDKYGEVIGTLGGHHIVGVPYRIRAEWHGTKAVSGRRGEWVRLEFRH